MFMKPLYIAVFLISLFSGAIAFAQNNRSAVSVSGSDANTCTTISPCRSFSVALAHTNAGGEVIAFDSGGYGAFTINQAVSVIGAPGIHAALTVTSGDGIVVAAGSGDRVQIRGLNITMTSASGSGINATTFGALAIENCRVNGGATGILIAGDSDSRATVADTVTRAAQSYGFQIHSRAILVRCRAEGRTSSIGLSVTEGATADGIVSAVEFVATGHDIGAYANSGVAGHKVALDIDRALISSNAYGIWCSQVATGMADTTVRITNSTVAENLATGLYQVGDASFSSMNNNLVAGNGFDTAGTITAVTVH